MGEREEPPRFVRCGDGAEAAIRGGWAAARMAAEKFNEIERSMIVANEPMAAGEFLEREAGGRYHRALLVADAEAACEHLFEELRHDGDAPADLLAALERVKVSGLVV